MSKQIAAGNVLVVKTDTPHVVDVFVGSGWDRWSRFNVVKGHPKLINGQPLTGEDYETLKQVARAL